jgi:tRNA pseudouridine38-40 synthase
MQNFKITIAYDGTAYHGWQIQSEGRTIQGELTRVLSLLDSAHVTVHGAGRTDAGVHALGQVANFILKKEFDPTRLREAINANLDRDIRVLSVQVVDESFNARFSARSKSYRYRIRTGAVVSPFEYKYVYHHRERLDLRSMQSAATVLLGKHDFSAFTVAGSESESHVRTLRRLDVREQEGLISIEAEAEGFLRYMVRTIAGTLLEVGRGKIEAADLTRILESQSRVEAGPTAPALGLTLLRVDY